MAVKAEGLCGLCVALFEDLCRTDKDPVYCQVYEDYITGRVKGEIPLEFVLQYDPDKANAAIMRLYERMEREQAAAETAGAA